MLIDYLPHISESSIEKASLHSGIKSVSFAELVRDVIQNIYTVGRKNHKKQMPNRQHFVLWVLLAVQAKSGYAVFLFREASVC